MFDISLAQAESLTWWFGIATLISLIALAILTSILPRLEEKYEKIAWKMDVGFAWLSVLLFFLTFWASNIVSDKQDDRFAAKTISPEKRATFISFLKNYPKGPVRVFTISLDNDTSVYAGQIRSMLDDAGYAEPDHAKAGLYNAAITVDPPADVAIVIGSRDKAPPYAAPLQAAFKAIGIYAPGIVEKEPLVDIKPADICVFVIHG
jgi:hypothetical protein